MATHRLTGTRLFHIWVDMRQRCYNQNYPGFHRWGGKGVEVCEEWKNDFLCFHDWALANGYNDALTIDRIDGNGNYTPKNCRWATYKEQARNLTSNHIITIDGESRLLCDWLELSPITASTYHKRKKRGWSDKEALFEPPYKRLVSK
jgi:hypothetical protein